MKIASTMQVIPLERRVGDTSAHGDFQQLLHSMEQRMWDAQRGARRPGSGGGTLPFPHAVGIARLQRGSPPRVPDQQQDIPLLMPGIRVSARDAGKAMPSTSGGTMRAARGDALHGVSGGLPLALPCALPILRREPGGVGSDTQAQSRACGAALSMSAAEHRARRLFAVHGTAEAQVTVARQGDTVRLLVRVPPLAPADATRLRDRVRAECGRYGVHLDEACINGSFIDFSSGEFPWRLAR
ncbi:hypothetical protein [Cupriavidus sp. WS]|uniref:hypothetical protein n=1 Tax=Cupriavidus sp. WS TaxID=1312922 RepID=UPI0012DD6459|nr:hypothetical protein [Cupriavidus sp. WS]